VEQVVITPAEDKIADEWFMKILAIAENILQALELPYRVVSCSTGDMGAGKYKMFDIETWMPSRGNYGETHSNSHLRDWQARRLAIRYRTREGRIAHAFTLNNTALASPRILIALWENFQDANGGICVPKVLTPYVGTDYIAPRHAAAFGKTSEKTSHGK
jgi:seryl-tRNA synthetase